MYTVDELVELAERRKAMDEALFAARTGRPYGCVPRNPLRSDDAESLAAWIAEGTDLRYRRAWHKAMRAAIHLVTVQAEHLHLLQRHLEGR